MRVLAALIVALSSTALFVLGCQNLGTGTGEEADAATATAAGDAGAATAEAGGFVGGGCGKEASSGAELCIATSMCPSVVVDTASTPGCGFRVRGGVVDLVCACGTSICPMGTFSTCAEASKLLADQTQPGVCLQVAEGRCSESAAATPTTPTGGNPACDQACMKDCGGGEACASVCNCD